MDIPVLVEPLANHGFRAISGEPLHLEAEGPTREEAIQRLRQLIEHRMAAGAEVVAVSVAPSTHPLTGFAGMLKDDPLVEPWKKAMADYRQKSDGGSNLP